MWRLLKSAMICVAMAMGFSPSAVLGGAEECGAAVKRGDYEFALEECRTAAEQGNTTAQFNLGRVLMERSRTAEARRELEKAEALRPDDPDVRAALRQLGR